MDHAKSPPSDSARVRDSKTACRRALKRASTPGQSPKPPKSRWSVDRPLWIVALTETLTAVYCDDTSTVAGGTNAFSDNLSLAVDNSLSHRRSASTSMALRLGGRRHLVVVPVPMAELLTHRLHVCSGDEVLAQWDRRHLQSPVREVHHLVDGLTEPAKARLLRLVLATAASLFHVGRSATFNRVARDILSAMALPTAAPDAVGRAARLGAVASVTLPASAAPVLPEALAVVGQSGIAQLRDLRLHFEGGTDGGKLHLFLAPAVAGADALVVLGDRPWLIDLRAARAPQDIAIWHGRQPAAVKGWIKEELKGETSADAALALLEELSLSDDRLPTFAIDHAAATATGVLLAVRLDDPAGLVEAVDVAGGDGVATCPIAQDRSHHLLHVDLGGEVAEGQSVRARLVLRSGRKLASQQAYPTAFDGSIPDDILNLDATSDVDVQAVATACGKRLGTTARIVDDCRIGEASAAARISLLVPASVSPDVLRCRAAMIAAEPERRSVDCVYLIAKDGPVAAIRRLLSDLDLVYGTSARVLVVDGDPTSADALLAAARALETESVLLMGADVLPQGLGWLGAWRRLLIGKRANGIVGGAVLASDGRIVDAGAAIHRQGHTAERLPHKLTGLPASHLAKRTHDVDALGADYTGLPAVAVQELRGLVTAYGDGAVLLADLAATLQRSGNSVRVNPKLRSIRYGGPKRCDPSGFAAALDARLLAGRLNDLDGEQAWGPVLVGGADVVRPRAHSEVELTGDVPLICTNFLPPAARAHLSLHNMVG